MDDNPITQTDSFVNTLQDLLVILLSSLSRPAVRWQLLTIALILCVA
ncbi:MAG: hypothetical protein GY759_22580 [Chloroflexi bacterium]|nr:hypothetical protein [Chloroflexota bacterium]